MALVTKNIHEEFTEFDSLVQRCIDLKVHVEDQTS